MKAPLLAILAVIAFVAGTGAVLMLRLHGAGSDGPPRPAGSRAYVASPAALPAHGHGPVRGQVTAATPVRGGCVARPGACGYPYGGNTGVPEGMTLRSVPRQVSSGRGWHFDPRGWVEVDGNGAVLKGLYIPYNVNVQASGVTIADDRIVVSGNRFGISLRHTRNVTIEDCDIYSPSKGYNRLQAGIKDSYQDSVNLSVLDNNIWHTSTGVQVESGLVAGNYIHSPGYRPGDHINGVASDGGGRRPLTIRHNTILIDHKQTDAIGLFEDFGPQRNRTVVGNLLAGGGYTIYAGQNHGGPPVRNVRIIGNRVSRVFFSGGGYYGPLTSFNAAAAGDAWSGNTWDETASAIRVP